MIKTYAKTPTIYQMEACECGAASLAMILAYFGCSVPLEKLRIETGVSRDGCKAGNIVKTAKRYGLNCCGSNCEIEDLPKLSVPCIIHWGFNHFVVYEGMKHKKLYINDPSCGRRILSAKEFDDNFTGIAITFSPSESFVKTKKEKHLLCISNEFKGSFKAIANPIFAGILTAVPGIALPMLTQFIFDNILNDRQAFNMVMIFMLASILLHIFLTLYKDLILAKMQKHASLVFGYKFLKKMLALPIEFFNQRYASDISGRVDSGIEIAQFLTRELYGMVFNVFTALIYLAFMMIYSPAISAAFAAGTIALLLLTKLISDSVSQPILKCGRERSSLMGKLCAGIGNIKTLKSSNAKTGYLSSVLSLESKIRASEQPIGKAQSISAAAKETAFSIMMILVLLSGSMLILSGRFTVGMSLTYSALFLEFISAVSNTAYTLRGMKMIKLASCRISDISNYGTETDQPKNKDIVSKLSGAVELKNVCFGYSVYEKPLIEDFSFKLPPGKSIAITGDSGCGKSTVAKLISGLCRPWSGDVMFDGVPLPEIPREILCASVSAISQRITLFSGTVRNNITLWNENIRDNDIINAAKDACIHDTIISKPGAYDYVLKENAVNLSGGQRQCLEIARALAANPSILIMDEATSALDPITEKRIINNIKRRGCTCIVIAHRFSTIRCCDEIIVMENGTISRRLSRNDSGKFAPEHIEREADYVD